MRLTSAPRLLKPLMSYKNILVDEPLIKQYQLFLKHYDSPERDLELHSRPFAKL